MATKRKRTTRRRVSSAPTKQDVNPLRKRESSANTEAQGTPAPKTKKAKVADWLAWADMGSRQPLDDTPMTCAQTLLGIERIEAWCRSARDLLAQDERIPAQVRAMNRTIDGVRGPHRETDLRNLVIDFIVRIGSSWLSQYREMRDLGPCESRTQYLADTNEATIVADVFVSGIDYARSLSPVLADRLVQGSARACAALHVLPGGRRTALFALTNVLDGTDTPNSKEARHRTARLFDRWRRVRRGALVSLE